MVFTAIIQSSSASVGILQTLASSGLIGLHSAAFILFGQNIGTCITAVLASIGTSRNAKRTTIIHLLFNVIGTVIFTTICILTPLTNLFESLLPTSPAGQIAALHTTFNITTDAAAPALRHAACEDRRAHPARPRFGQRQPAPPAVYQAGRPHP